MSISRITANASAKSVLNDRLALLDNGFTPLPADGKAVYLKGWPTRAINEIDLRRWSKDDDLADHTNTGLRMGDGLVAVDVDVVDPAMARRLDKMADALAPDLAPRRIGKAPKALLLFQIDGNGFETFKSTAYLDKEGRQNKIEILATGSQFIAFGIHPDTGKPYQWEDDHSPLTIHRDDLPMVTEEALRQFVMEVEMAFEEAGWTPAPTYTRDGVFDRDAALDAIESGADLHDSSRDLAAHFAAVGWVYEDICREIEGAFQRCKVKDARWRARLSDLPRMIKTALRKYGDKWPDDDEEEEEGSESRKPVKRDPVLELNRRHAVITVGGKTKIATFTAEGVALGEEKDLRLRYGNRFAPADPRAVDRAELIGGNPPCTRSHRRLPKRHDRAG